MSEDNRPYYERMDELTSYLGGGNWAGLGEAIPIAISNFLGMPRQYPYVLNLRPDRDVYQSFYDRQVNAQLSPILGDVRQRNLDMSEQNLTTITGKLSKVLGIELSRENVDFIRNTTRLAAKYGPGVLQGIKKVLQADGVTPDDTTGKIIEGLTNQLDQVFDALYGPVGDRLPFYGALKDSIRDTVAVDEQAAILQNVVQRLYPNDTNLDQTFGLTAAQVGELYTAMTARGLSPLNMGSSEAQYLMRESVSQDVSPAEKKAIIENLASKQRREIYKASGFDKAIETLTQKANENNKKTGRPEVSYRAISDYATQIYKDKYLVKAIQESGIVDKTGRTLLKDADTLSSAEIPEEYKGDRTKYIKWIASQLAIHATALEGSNKPEDKARIKQLNNLSDQVMEFANVHENYEQSGGYIDTKGNRLYGEQFVEAVEGEIVDNLTQSLLNSGITKEDAGKMAYAMFARDKLSSFDNIDVDKLTNDAKYRQGLLDDKNLTEEVKDWITTYTTQNEDLDNKTFAQIAKEADEKLKSISETKATKKYDDVLAAYRKVLAEGTPQDIMNFENDPQNRDVITQIKANELGKKSAEDITNWAGAYTSMQKAIERAGGTINGQKIQFMPRTTNPAVVQVMEMITQKDLSNMTSDEIHDFFTTVGTGMEKAGLGADQALQFSGLAATEAAKVGADRAVAGKTGTKLGLAAAAFARREGYGNAERLGSMVAQAAGRASKSLVTQYTGAIMYGANDETISRMKDTRAQDIVRKIKNRNRLSQEDLSYLQEHGKDIMADMGMTPEQMTSYMLSPWTGREGEYALEQGTAFLLGNENSDMLVATRDAIGTSLRSVGVDEDAARNKVVTQTIVDTMTENIGLVKDNKMDAFRDVFLKNLDAKLKNGEITQEQYDKVATLDSGQLWNAVNRGRNIVGKFTGDSLEGLKAISSSKSILDEKTRLTVEGKVQKLFGTVGSENPYSNIIQAMAKPDANLGDVFTAFMTNGGKLNDEQMQRIGYGVALMSLLRPEAHISDFTYNENSKEAENTLNKLAKVNPDDADNTFNLIKQADNIINEKLKVGNIQQALTLLDKEEDLKKLLENGTITEEDVAALRQMQGLLIKAGVDTDEFTKMTGVISDRTKQTVSSFESSQENIPTTPSDIKPPKKVKSSTTEESKETTDTTRTTTTTTPEEVSAATAESSATKETISVNTTTAPSSSAAGSSASATGDTTTTSSNGTYGQKVLDLLNNVIDGEQLKVRVTNTQLAVSDVNDNATTAQPTNPG